MFNAKTIRMLISQRLLILRNSNNNTQSNISQKLFFVKGFIYVNISPYLYVHEYAPDENGQKQQIFNAKKYN